MKLTDLHKDIDAIELNVTSEKSVFKISSLAESIKTVYDDRPLECKYLTDFTVDVYAVDGMGEKIIDIGFLKGTSIEAEITFADVDSFLLLCDMASTDLYHMAVAICDKEGHVKESICPPDYNIMYIENMYVEEKCRGLGFGKYLLNNINDLFFQSLNYTHRTFILKPYPQIKCSEHSLNDLEGASVSEKKRLIDFYEKAGYQFIDGSDYMYKIQADQTEELLQMLGI